MTSHTLELISVDGGERPNVTELEAHLKERFYILQRAAKRCEDFMLSLNDRFYFLSKGFHIVKVASEKPKVEKVVHMVRPQSLPYSSIDEMTALIAQIEYDTKAAASTVRPDWHKFGGTPDRSNA